MSRPVLTYKEFQGYSLVDEPTNLPLGSLIDGSKNIDLTRKIGGLPKRLGLEALFVSLGSGGVKGIHTYRHSSGDVVLFGHGTSLYKLSGNTSTLTKTTTADFDAGTKDASILTVGNQLAMNAVLTDELLDQDTGSAGYTIYSDLGEYVTGQTFVNQKDEITAISVYLNRIGTTGSVRIKLYNDSSKSQLLGTSDTAGIGGWSFYKFPFSSPVIVSKGNTYYFEIEIVSANNRIEYGYFTASQYVNGSLYRSGAAQAQDLCFKTYGKNGTNATGSWTSPVYDRIFSPVSSTLAWNATTPANTSLTVKIKGSEDSQNWGDWQTVLSSGGGTPLARYLQIKLEFQITGINNISLQDFTATYISAYTTASAIKTGLSGNKLRFVDYNGVCYFCDGGRPWRYDNANVRSVGVDPPTAPTIVGSGSGSLSTHCKALVTIVNEYGAESNGGTATGIVTVTNAASIAWSSIPAGPAGTSARKLYRTKDNGSTYYYVTTLSNNTTTTYTDTTTDANLITPLATDNNSPPNTSILHSHKGYMLFVSASNPNLLYFSKPGAPDNVPALAYKTLPGSVQSVKSYADAAVTQGDSFCVAIYGDVWDKDIATPIDNTRQVNISLTEGSISHEATAHCFSAERDILVFPTRTGLKFLTPSLQENSLQIAPLSRDVQPIFDGIPLNYKANMSAAFHKERYLIALTYYGTGTPVQTNNIIMVYDMRTGKWSPPWEIASAGFCVANNRLFMGSSNIGRLFEMEKSTSDDGANINAVAVLASTFTPHGAYRKKRFKRLKVAVADNSVTSTLTLTPKVDGATQTITPGTWTGNVSEKQKITLGKGSKFDLTISDNSTKDWIITEIPVEYRAGGV